MNSDSYIQFMISRIEKAEGDVTSALRLPSSFENQLQSSFKSRAAGALLKQAGAKELRWSQRI